MSLRAWLPLVCSLCALPGCKDRGSSGQDSRPLPSPEPPPSATRDEPAPTKKRPLDDDAREVSRPKRPAVEEPSKAAPARPEPAVSAGTAQPDATGPSAASPSSGAPVLTAPSAACLARCQGALQGCLAQPVDGGVPGFANLDLCKKAFEACQAACAQ